ncbi:SpoIID/LytB domain-containing protein [Paenibacillus sp. MBLB4367]|uniref:SpoIID/LytB domain-containing protein n=1 Tax=Paenibacillus sp. MBLB4367 TaxID=3384767 RepID=UPI0039082DC0
MTKRIKKRLIVGAAVSLLSAAVPIQQAQQAYAAAAPAAPAVAKLDAIRVALFLDNGKYRASAPVVTLSSDKGLTVGLRNAAGSVSWLGGDSLTNVRASADQFGFQALETDDPAKATALSDKLRKAGYAAAVWKRARQGKAIYQVSAGAYPTKDAAATALFDLMKNAEMAKLLQAQQLTGPLHLSAGVFASEAEAAAKQTALEQAGIDADLVYTDNGAGGAAYAVWIGRETDADRLNAIKQQAAKAVPGLALAPVEAKSAYLLKREDISDGTTKPPVMHVLFNPGGQKVTITTKQGEIKVAEKNGRTYRGSMELSVWSGKLALINELPFEQYLYSVVTAEMGKGWPVEALKAQAVAARSYALKLGNKYDIAHVSDSVTDQAYNGEEDEGVIRAVDLTKGEVLVASDGAVVMPYFSANAGGMTAEPTEVWGNPVGYLKSVMSPDEGAAKGRVPWYQVELSDGSLGYVSSAYLRETGTRNAAGFAIMEPTENGVNVRSAPSTDASGTVTGKLDSKDKVTAVRKVEDSNSFQWQRGPYDAAELRDKINAMVPKAVAGELQRLEVTRRGASGRAAEVKANGQPIKVDYGDAFRTVFLSLPSSKFDIEETGRYTILGANGATRTLPETTGTLYAVGADQAKSGGAGAALAKEQWIAVGKEGQARVLTNKPQFLFTGQGNGHGLGMSQWGARGLAERGYDYRSILQYYYTGVTLAKD